MRFSSLPLIIAALFVGLSSPANASIVRYTVVNAGLIRGGQPTESADFQALKKDGIKTVINLRTTESSIEWERNEVTTLGMNYRVYPIDGMSYPSAATINSVLKDMEDPALQPVFVHCHEGKDRTGLVVGLYRVLFSHWMAADAYAEMVEIGFDPKLTGLANYFWDHATVTKRSRRRN